MEQTGTNSNLYDVVVVGGGMVGAATAIGLAQLGLQVVVVEAFAPQAYDSEQALDLRVSAISAASEALLERLGALSGLDDVRKVAYKGLETWELEGCITQFHSDQIGCSHLGHIVENRLIQLALWGRMQQLDNITLLCPAKIATLTRANEQDCIYVTLDNQERLSTRLLIGADGANSMVRQWANIGISGWDYAQSAMLINIETACAEQDVTWQQFTPSGPRSLLPLPGNNASLVWYDDATKIAQLTQLNNKALQAQIDQHFPSRLDREFKVINKASFKLTRRHAQTYYRDNLVILGDAAHTINPLAGQGVNLGFKDVDALVNTIAKHLEDGNGWWKTAVLAEYQKARYRDNQLMMSTMDLFYASFSNDILPLKLLRNGALKLANIDTPIKKQVLKYAMGF
ncbi:FAD-dependent oxidoreductase [Shewanella fidelis]|uniref:FAD-dependent oxidoreductase n=2 Tax=Shewanella fidelis TaxID=173509 RepID=A0AAW8NJ90_9GAMM|nr:FAD-dependent oxidoreductase [Shewanella fidelis]MDR8522820.1 FAD-dependent oxidoreductase [Shewanella fidelis]MDW4814157.1 FAD-dependent oxidoreductase [Shewanella fidelis]MDW4818134.1 FAD-dependent oxidoreductase [Shewanella fidelis]MDW4822201.1 FAD-dependent oxidoreductase [Shewanella fidelis]MDW4826584.1 FAD-dependent oxidoreductase [Shewanella fidelis]